MPGAAVTKISFMENDEKDVAVATELEQGALDRQRLYTLFGGLLILAAGLLAQNQ